MKVLLTGANGQLGQCVQDVFAGSEYQLISFDRQGLDISNAEQVRAVCAELAPDIIINAAAYTAVDKAESEREQAQKINEQGAENLAVEAQRHGALLIHISTDYVFNGEKQTPYQEDDPVEPQGVYGQTKLAGEQAVQRRCERHVILRTAWVFSEYGNNFLKTMLRLGAEREELGIVSDQLGCPSYAGDIAGACLAICEAERANTASYGIYHYAGGESLSWYDFASVIFTTAVEQGVLTTSPQLNAITTADFPTPAKRPSYSVLSSEKFTVDYGVPASDWRLGVKVVLARLVKDN